MGNFFSQPLQIALFVHQVKTLILAHRGHVGRKMDNTDSQRLTLPDIPLSKQVPVPTGYK